MRKWGNERIGECANGGILYVEAYFFAFQLKSKIQHSKSKIKTKLRQTRELVGRICAFFFEGGRPVDAAMDAKFLKCAHFSEKCAKSG